MSNNFDEIHKLMYYPGLLRSYYTTSFKEIVKKYSLAQIEVEILLFLKNNPRHNTARDICQIRGLSKSNVSTSISRLEERKYLRSQFDENGRKVRRLFLTEDAKVLVQELVQIQNNCMEEIFRGFNEEEIRVMQNYMERISRNID